MTTYGLTPTGFVPKTMAVLIASFNAQLQAAFGVGFNVTNGLVARYVAITCERLTELWELAETVNASTDPDGATGARLREIALLTGTFAADATSSDVTLTMTGIDSTVVAVGSRAKTASTARVFTTLANATLTTLTSWGATTAYIVGDRRTNASRCYVCITAGTSAGSGGPTTTASDITDGSTHWRFLGEGVAASDVTATCTITGPITAVSGDITVIDTPVGGWQSVINLLDALIGNDETSDQGLRLLREAELSLQGAGTADAIRAELLSLIGVTAATVFKNDTDVTDIDGVLPHSVEALVVGGDDTAIRRVLFDQVGAGIRTVSGSGGTTVIGTVSDSQGNAQTITFTRPAETDIWVDVTYVKDPATYPVDGDAEVKAAIAGVASTGVDAVASRIGAKAFGVTGVLDVTSVKIGTAPSPTLSTTIAISTRQFAAYDTSRVTVHTSDGTP